MKRLLGARAALLRITLLLRHLLFGSVACPCEQPALCNPISTAWEFEVFVFDVGGKTWKSYDWTYITTVVTFGNYDPELLCYAHSFGSRVVLSGNISVKNIVKPAIRAAWIKQKIGLSKNQYMDGINIDIEQTIKKSSAEYYALTALVKETTEAFHKEIPGSQVTFDVPWSPNCNIRCYNYTGIADSCDFLFVMSYDEQNPEGSGCIARANAPYRKTLAGYDHYIRLGINPKKLVMGVPWYGYDYTCPKLSQTHICFFAKNILPIIKCRDVKFKQAPYEIIMKLERSSFTGILWNEEQQSPYLEYKDSKGAFHQIWFDNPKSISLKAAYVKERGLKGIGMWNANCLNYSSDSVAQQQTEAMWKALKPVEVIKK